VNNRNSNRANVPEVLQHADIL